MVNFYDNFTTNLSAWIASSAAPVNRAWFLQGGLLKTEQGSTQYGLIRYNQPIDVNGRVVVDYNNMDLYNGSDNFVVLRFTDTSHFVYVAIQPGTDQYDERGLVIGFNTLGQLEPNVTLYNVSGFPLSGEIAPNKTSIPQTGILDVKFTGNKYDFVVRNATSAFLASGTYIDTLNRNLTSGYVGFGHSNKWDANMDGWDSININDYAPVAVAPTINSFVATPSSINLGESTTLSWNITSGTAPTSAYLTAPINSAVPLAGTYITYPTTGTTYTLSAWSSAGVDTETTVVTVSNQFPIVTSFTNSGPISTSQSATLNWNISAATSAFIDNGIGWITPYTSAGSRVTQSLLFDTTYSISAYDADLDLGTASTTVLVQQLPTASLSVVGAPTCSGSTYNLVWTSQYGTTATIDNGIGNVPLSGSYTVTATTPKNYILTVGNSIGQAQSNANALVYYRAPIANAGNDQNINSPTGNPVSVTVNASNSYSVEGLPLTYAWYNGMVLIGTTQSLSFMAPVGTTTLTLQVYDSCGFSSTDTVNIVVVSNIPPVAKIVIDKTLLSQPGSVSLNGSYSSDYDGYIASYIWTDNGVLISNTPIFDYYIPTFGTHDITLVVTDNNGLTDVATVQVLVDAGAIPIANAGSDSKLCSNGVAKVYLFGNNSVDPTVPDGATIVWFEWTLSEFGVPNIASNITSLNQISATFNTTVMGVKQAQLTVSASNGVTSSDTCIVEINAQPTISTSPDVVEYLQYGESQKSVTVSAFSNSPTSASTYSWRYDIGGYDISTTGQFLTLNLAEGVYSADAFVQNNDTGCRSGNATVNIKIIDNSMSIVDFSVDPSYAFVTDNSPTYLELSWNIKNAISAYIDGIGSVNPVAGTYNIVDPVTATTNKTFILSAYDGVHTITQTITGQYFYNYIVSACKQRDDLVTTYGLDELKYSKDRDINLVNYLPDYIRNTQTQMLLETFEGYMNNMFKGQRNYTWEEDKLDVTVSQTIADNQHTSCNDMFYDCCVSGVGCSATILGLKGATYTSACSGTCGNLVTSGSTNRYSFDITTSAGIQQMIATTPAYSAGEVFVNNMCGITDDKISILDKIFRLTDLFDPDLIPIELIQHYAENLGYQAGINRDSVYSSRNSVSRDLEQRRYLRFMVRNLPTWYQIKSTPAAIAIMLYSFGLIGNFVYYYTRCYSDMHDVDDYGMCDGTTVPTICDKTSNNSVPNGLCFNRDINNFTSKDISIDRCCLQKYNGNAASWIRNTKRINGLIVDDWVLTGVNTKTIQEDLGPVEAAEKQNPGYFATPHFKIWVEIAQSTGNYSTDPERQRTMRAAVNAVKPINTVFDGVAAFFDPGVSVMYARGLSRVRRSMRIISDGTWNVHRP